MFYRLYGKTIKSEIPLLQEDEKKSKSLKYDFLIKERLNISFIGFKKYHEIFVNKEKVAIYYKKNNSYAVKMMGYGKFIINNKKIEANFYRHVSAQDKTQVLCNQLMPLLLHSNNNILLHASSVIIKNKAYLFVGKSGSGKSTLAGYLATKNHKIISDDVALLKWKGGRFYVVPSFSQIRLTHRSFLNLLKKNSHNKIQKQIIRGSHHSKRKHLVHKIYVLDEGRDISINSLSSFSLIQSVLPHFYRLSLIDKSKLAFELNFIEKLAQSNLVYKFKYPRIYKKLPQVVRAIQTS